MRSALAKDKEFLPILDRARERAFERGYHRGRNQGVVIGGAVTLAAWGIVFIAELVGVIQ